MNLQALTRRIASALPLAGITLTAAPAHAAQPFIVQDIRIEGLKRIEPSTLFAYLPIKQGSTFNDDGLRKPFARSMRRDYSTTSGSRLKVRPSSFRFRNARRQARSISPAFTSSTRTT